MDDRELLERAARAADYPEHASWLMYPEGSAPPGPRWNPLESDGDALRLAVKLNLDVRQCEPATTAYPRTAAFAAAPGQPGHLAMYDPDPYAATRRAIVRAAASLAQGGGTE